MDNSAKVSEEKEISPQTNYVTIYSDGSCEWNPRFDLSVTKCHVDVTWFPFDEQTCNLTFESWFLDDSVLELEADDINMDEFDGSVGWIITGVTIKHLKYVV